MKEAVTYRLFIAPAAILLIPAAVTASRVLGKAWRIRTVAALLCAVALTASTMATVILVTRTMDGRGPITTSTGYVLRGLLLHRKYESDIQRVFTEARLTGEPYYRHKVFQGIGWGMEFRFESDPDLSPLRAALASLPVQERASFLSGAYGWSSIRLRQLRARVRAGESGPGEAVLIQRLTILNNYGREQWRRIPPGSLDSVKHHPQGERLKPRPKK